VSGTPLRFARASAVRCRFQQTLLHGRRLRQSNLPRADRGPADLRWQAGSSSDTTTAASSSPTTSSASSPSSASSRRRPSSGSPAAPSGSSGRSRETCYGRVASPASRSCARRSTPSRTPTTEPGSSSATATARRPRSVPTSSAWSTPPEINAVSQDRRPLHPQVLRRRRAGARRRSDHPAIARDDGFPRGARPDLCARVRPHGGLVTVLRRGGGTAGSAPGFNGAGKLRHLY